jgi:hypothetical protein
MAIQSNLNLKCETNSQEHGASSQMNAQPPAPNAERQLTESELSAIKKHLQRSESETPVPRIRVSADGVSLDHPSEDIASVLLMEALGTASPDFVDGLVRQLVAMCSDGEEISEKDVNFALSVIIGLKPKDHNSTMLAAEIAAVHLVAMKFARRTLHAETHQDLEIAERVFNRATRTFPTQLDAFKRCQSAGEQKVTVQNVSVTKGGQAIVGNVTEPQVKPGLGRLRRAATHDAAH